MFALCQQLLEDINARHSRGEPFSTLAKLYGIDATLISKYNTGNREVPEQEDTRAFRLYRAIMLNVRKTGTRRLKKKSGVRK